MNTTEAAVVCVSIVAATVAAILGHLEPPLIGLLGVAVGYGGKGMVNLASSSDHQLGSIPKH